MLGDLSSKVQQMERQLKDASVETVELRKKYRIEMLQRKRLYNKIQEMKGNSLYTHSIWQGVGDAQRHMKHTSHDHLSVRVGNIRVFCRCRHDPRGEAAITFLSDQELLVPQGNGSEKVYEFDNVYGCDSKQETVYEDTSPIITSCVDGYNVCILGKRYLDLIVY
jgi:hypothetical protein